MSEARLLDRLAVAPSADGPSLLNLLLPLLKRWKLLAAGSLLGGAVVLGVSYLMTPMFTSRAVFIPPQQQQSAALSALSQLGGLAGLAGAATGVRSPAEQYVALLQSSTVSDRLIDKFKLMQVYEAAYRFEARKRLADNTRVFLGKRDGLITVEVDDELPQRAADIANGHVHELRQLTSDLALTEAQQRRAFFSLQLEQTRSRLTKAQQDLQASGFNQGALKADARAAAEGYARMRAESTAAEIRLQTLRRNLADSTPEVQQALTALTAIRGQLGQIEASVMPAGGADYVGKFREFKYQETLFELFARQFELARVDESREGAMIQVIDAAQPAERKSKPRRAPMTVGATVITFLLLSMFVFGQHAWQLAVRRRLGAAAA